MSQCLVNQNFCNYPVYDNPNCNFNQNNITTHNVSPNQNVLPQCLSSPSSNGLICLTNNVENKYQCYNNYNPNNYSNYIINNDSSVSSCLEKPEINYNLQQQQQHKGNYLYSPSSQTQMPPPSLQSITPLPQQCGNNELMQINCNVGNNGNNGTVIVQNFHNNCNFIATSPAVLNSRPPPQPPFVVPQTRINVTAAPPCYENINGPYAPCQVTKPWTYGYCYGYYGEAPCQFIDCDDMEDFMSNEKRKEKSRDAARCRRSRETDLFTELADGLPIRREEVEQLDKASVMRLAISFLKIHDVTKFFPQIKDLQIKDEAETKSEDSLPTEDDETKPFDRFWNNKDTINLLNNCLDGFLLILSSEGDITYSSDSISDYLGISQIDILGNPIWEYIHQCDHDELKEALNIRKNSLQDTIKEENNKEQSEFKTCHRDFFLRFKCTLTSRGRSVNIKSASYKVIHLVGHMVVNKEGEKILIAVGRPIPHPSNIEIPLGTTTFLTKHSLDMKFTYVDEKMQQELNYKADDLLGKSLYNYHHSCDSEQLMATFKSVLSKGQGETCRYRFLGKYGGYCWLVTQATIVYDKQKPQSVVCVNYLIRRVTTRPQFELLVSLMEENRNIAKGSTFVSNKNEYKSKWQEFSTSLNAIGPPQREGKAWEKVWYDMKSKVKQKLAHNKNEIGSTGGGPNKFLQLSDFEEKIADILNYHELNVSADSCQRKRFGLLQQNVEYLDDNLENNNTENMEMDINFINEEDEENQDITEQRQVPMSASRSSKSKIKEDRLSLIKKQLECLEEIKKETHESSRYLRKLYEVEKDKINLYKKRFQKDDEYRLRKEKWKCDILQYKKEKLRIEKIKLGILSIDEI